MRNTSLSVVFITLAVLASALAARAQPQNGVAVHAKLSMPAQARVHRGHPAPPTAVLWLNPMSGQAIPNPVLGKHVLTQKNRMFEPHLLVVPVGSTVSFPNRDPFFHNVFSLFDGKRFDLGLYEAGTSKEITFSREGLSYLFCNIHPEMSAVVLALSTPLYTTADANGAFHLSGVPPGDYELHLWMEGEKQPVLDRLTRRMHVGTAPADLGLLPLTPSSARPEQHTNLYGEPYSPEPRPSY